MERQAGKGNGPGKGLRLEWQVLRQPFPNRQSDDWYELERSPLLWLANGEVRSRCSGGPSRAGHWSEHEAGCGVGRAHGSNAGCPTALACQPTQTVQPPEARSPMTKAVAVTPRWPRREAREDQGELALRHLHPRLNRARLGARVQQARSVIQCQTPRRRRSYTAYPKRKWGCGYYNRRFPPIR